MTDERSGIAATMMDGSPSRSGDDGRDEALPTIERAHYRIDRELARGGMGRIFLARDRRLGRTVAVKEVLVTETALLDRFDREVRLTARLQHPGIVGVYEAGRWPTGEPFYAMRLIEGRPLENVIRATTVLAERLALLPHVLAIAEALAYAHAQRIIHRDLKPANVLVGTYGETVVIDWGLAKDLADDAGASVDAGPYRESGEGALTMLGSVMGTPSYMPIEQATGQLVDERADVYAIGAILYETLCGRPPYEGPTGMSILGKLISEEPPPLRHRVSGVPIDLLAIVDRAMARDPEARYRTAKELADDLRRFQDGQLVASHAYTRGELLRRWLRKYRTPVAIIAVATVALLGVGVTSYVRVVAARDQADEASVAAHAAATTAEAARATVTKRADDLLIVQARAAAKTDPTAAIAWLAQLSPESTRYRSAAMIAADATARGIAQLVPLADHAVALAASSDGRRVVALGAGGALWEIDAATRHARAIGTRAGAAFDEAIFSDDLTHGLLQSQTSIVTWERDGAAGAAIPVRDTMYDALARDGRHLAYATTADDVAVCDGSGEHCARIAAMPLRRGLEFLADGHTLLVADKERVALFEIGGPGAPTLVRASPASTQRVRGGIAVSTEEPVFAYIGPDGKIRIDNRGVPHATGLPCAERIAVAPDGSFAACLDNRTITFRTASGAVGPIIEHGDGVNAFAFGADHMFAAARSDGEIRIAVLDTPWQWSLLGHASGVRALAFVDGGKSLVSLGEDGAIRVWDVATQRRLVRATPSATADVVLSARGAAGYTQGGDAHVLRSGSIATPPATTAGGSVMAVDAVSLDGSVALVTTTGGGRAVWRTSGSELAPIAIDDNQRSGWWLATFVAAERIARAHEGPMTVSDLRSGAVVFSLPERDATVPFAFSSDLAFAVLGPAPGTPEPQREVVRVVSSGAERTLATGVPANTATAIAISADGRWFVEASPTASALCELATGTCRPIAIDDHDENTALIAIAADGRRVAIARKQVLHVYDATTGKLDTQLRLHAIHSLAMSADGSTVAGIDSSYNGTSSGVVFVRDVVTAEERVLPVGPNPLAVAFTAGTSVRVVLHDGNDSTIYDSVDPFPRDTSLRTALGALTNAVIDEHGAVASPR